MPPEKNTKPATPAAPAPAQPEETSLGRTIRELADEIVFVFAVFLFINIFIVEHYKIPTGSMTPTLLGGEIADVDVNGDKKNDVLFWMPEYYGKKLLIFLNKGDHWTAAPPDVTADAEDVRRWAREGKIRVQNSRILVNKMAYWFGAPKLGDIAIFKVPRFLFKPDEPIFIKRVAGEPGARLDFDEAGHLRVNGARPAAPAFYQDQIYRTSVNAPGTPGSRLVPEIGYQPMPGGEQRIVSIDVPKDEAYMLGDNTEGSLDSRYWGGVPLENFKGRAFVHFWPWRKFKFL